MFSHLLISLLVAGATLAAPTDVTPKSPIAKSNDKDAKAAAPLTEQDKARTHSLLSLLHRPRPPLTYAPTYAYPAYYEAPVVLKPAEYYYQKPVEAAQETLEVAPAHLPVVSQLPVIEQPKPVIVEEHKPVVVEEHKPVVSHTYTKPVVTYTTQVVKKPAYPVSQQVFHRPVITEVKKIIRQPVISEVLQYVHQPHYTEYQQVYKIPTYTQHIVVKPSIHTEQYETVQKPIVLQGEKLHVVSHPTHDVQQLPEQLLKPYTHEVVKVPHVEPPTQTVPEIHTAPVTQQISYIPVNSYEYGSEGGISGGFSQGGLSGGFSHGGLSGGFSQGGLSGGFSHGGLSGGFSQGSLSGGVSQGSLSGGVSHGGFSEGGYSGGFSEGSSGGFSQVSGGVSEGGYHKGWLVPNYGCRGGDCDLSDEDQRQTEEFVRKLMNSEEVRKLIDTLYDKAINDREEARIKAIWNSLTVEQRQLLSSMVKGSAEPKSASENTPAPADHKTETTSISEGGLSDGFSQGSSGSFSQGGSEGSSGYHKGWLTPNHCRGCNLIKANENQRQAEEFVRKLIDSQEVRKLIDTLY